MDQVIGQNVKILMPPYIAKYHDQYLINFSKDSKRFNIINIIILLLFHLHFLLFEI